MVGRAAGIYDFAFIDADKTSYPSYESCLTLLRPGGLIVLDNVLPRRDRPAPAPDDESARVVAGLNERIAGDERVDVAMLAVADQDHPRPQALMSAGRHMPRGKRRASARRSGPASGGRAARPCWPRQVRSVSTTSVTRRSSSPGRARGRGRSRRPPASPDPVWDQPGVTEASAHDVPLAEYEDWARSASLELILFDENYQWEEVGALRAAGIRTVSRFVWEYFAPEHVAPARGAYETIYSLTRCERGRYAEMGIESPYVQWGIHPELLAAANRERRTARRRAACGERRAAGRRKRTREAGIPAGLSRSISPAPSSAGASRSARC